MVCRLERCSRHTSQERISKKVIGRTVPSETPSRNESKKSPNPGGITTEAAAWTWANRQKYQSHPRATAKLLIAQAGNLEPHQLRVRHAEQARAAIIKRYRANTAYQLVSHLKHLLRELEDYGSPKITITKIRKGRPRAVTASPDEIRAMKKLAAPWVRVWLILTAENGLRFMEAYRVAPAQHDRQNRTITVLAKGGKTRTIPTTPEFESLAGAVESAGLPRTMTYIEALAGKKHSPEALREQFRKLATKAGISRQINPHDLRRSAAQRLYQQTKDLRAVQRLLGHDHMSSTLHYLESEDPENIRPLIEALAIPTEVRQ